MAFQIVGLLLQLLHQEQVVMNGLFMAFQVVGLLLQFDVLASQAVHFVAQLEHLAQELLHEVQEISRRPGRGGYHKRAVHDKIACSRNYLEI